MKFSTGEVYNGEFQNDMMHGSGEMVYSNVMVYRGMWHCNLVREREREREREGKNELKERGGLFSCTIIQRHGEGTMVYEDESEYVGSWEMDLRHGEGNLTRRNGITYAGHWHQDLPHGEKGELNIASAKYKYIGGCHVTRAI